MRSTKTAEGFGSNYGAAGSKSVDRTEPPQAARVLVALYDKYNATYQDATGSIGLNWLIALMFQDLLELVQSFLLLNSLLSPTCAVLTGVLNSVQLASLVFAFSSTADHGVAEW